MATHVPDPPIRTQRNSSHQMAVFFPVCTCCHGESSLIMQLTSSDTSTSAEQLPHSDMVHQCEDLAFIEPKTFGQRRRLKVEFSWWTSTSCTRAVLVTQNQATVHKCHLHCPHIKLPVQNDKVHTYSGRAALRFPPYWFSARIIHGVAVFAGAYPLRFREELHYGAIRDLTSSWMAAG